MFRTILFVPAIALLLASGCMNSPGDEIHVATHSTPFLVSGLTPIPGQVLQVQERVQLSPTNILWPTIAEITADTAPSPVDPGFPVYGFSDNVAVIPSDGLLWHHEAGGIDRAFLRVVDKATQNPIHVWDVHRDTGCLAANGGDYAACFIPGGFEVTTNSL